MISAVEKRHLISENPKGALEAVVAIEFRVLDHM
jgi:hypothetical protein